jgi:hypothetical protein
VWSNCHLWAWKQFVRRGGVIAFSKTRYAALGTNKPEWWWLPFWACGVALQHVGAWVTFVGWVLRWRSWYHVYYAQELGGEWWEFVPDSGTKEPRIIAPLIFSGGAQKKGQ